MPLILRQIGPPFQRKDGTTIKPKALIATCEVCGSNHAPFGDLVDGKRKQYCGWINGRPVCLEVKK